MPITTEIAALACAGPRPLGAYIASLASAAADLPDFLAVAVEPGDPDPAADGALDELLSASAAEVVAAHHLTGSAGETAHVLASVAGRAISVLLIGVGDRSPASLRRA
ncbi:MAG: M17 family peptidase N-terminal domain-containing protein, partial [Streptosporangiaceae bacterium]